MVYRFGPAFYVLEHSQKVKLRVHEAAQAGNYFYALNCNFMPGYTSRTIEYEEDEELLVYDFYIISYMNGRIYVKRVPESALPPLYWQDTD